MVLYQYDGIQGLSRKYPAMHYDKERHLLKKIQDTRNILRRQWCLSPLPTRHLGTSHSSPNCYQFPESRWWSVISSLSMVILVWGKVRSCRVPNQGCRAAESAGWFDVLPKNSAWDVRRDQARRGDKAARHQLPIAAAFWIVQIVLWRNVQA